MTFFEKFLWQSPLTRRKTRKCFLSASTTEEHRRWLQSVDHLPSIEKCEKFEIVKLKFSWFWPFPLQVTYLKNFSLFVEPKVETLGIQEHVSLGKTLVSNLFWWNAWNINISKNLQYRWKNGAPKGGCQKKKGFFGRSLPNVGGWGGWIPNKVQTP